MSGATETKMKTLTEDEARLVETYENDPANRWHGLEELLDYVDRAPLNRKEAGFYNRLIRAIEKRDSLVECDRCAMVDCAVPGACDGGGE